MTSSPVLFGVVLLLAFLTGYAIRRGSICAVIAARMLVLHGRSARMRAFGLAAATSGSVIVPLQWSVPEAATLSDAYPFTWVVLAAGALVGLGARVNDACALGTLAHLTGGRTDYAFTILGMVAGAAIALVMIGPVPASVSPSRLASPDALSIAVLTAFASAVILTLHRRVPYWMRSVRQPQANWIGPYRAMLVVGTCSGLLYALAGNWTYLGVLTEHTAWLIDRGLTTTLLPAILAAIAVAAGGVFAAWRSGNFAVQPPAAGKAIRCTIGGLLMGAASTMIPGGNGVLLVYSVPSLAPHAAAAYTVMTVVLCLSYLASRAD